MKKCIQLALGLILAVPMISTADELRPTLSGVVCERNAQTGATRECTVDELKLMIHLLKSEKANGEALQKKADHKIAKGLVIVGGTWFISSAALYVLENYTSFEIPDVVATAITSSRLVSAVATGLYIGGVTVAPAMALIGGVILEFTPTKVADGTLTAYFTKDENFGKIFNYDETTILSLAEQDAVLAQKIVTVSSVVMAAAK